MTIKTIATTLFLLCALPLGAWPRTVCKDGETVVLVLSNRDYDKGLRNGTFTAGECPAPEPPPEPRPPVVTPPGPLPPPVTDSGCTQCPVPDPTPVDGSPYKTCTVLIFPDMGGQDYSLGVVSNIGTKRGSCFSDKAAFPAGFIEPMAVEEFAAPEGFRGVVRTFCDFDAVGLQYGRIFAHAGVYAIVESKEHRQSRCKWE